MIRLSFTSKQLDNGFTLIELLVVISIIALLLGIVLPSLKRAKEHARRVICMSHLSQLAKGVETYEAENDFKRFVARKDNSDQNLYWMGRIAPYIGNEHYGQQYEIGSKIDLLLCPSAPYSKFQTDPSLVVSGTGQIGTSTMPWEWNRASGMSTRSSYGINSFLAYDNYYEPNVQKYKDGAYNNWISTPGNVPLFSCARWLQGYPMGSDRAPVNLSGTEMFDKGNQNHMERFCIDRHNKQINMIYKNLSVESVRLVDLWQKQWHKGYVRPAEIRLPAQ